MIELIIKNLFNIIDRKLIPELKGIRNELKGIKEILEKKYNN